MNKLLTIALLASLANLAHADCGCAHSPKDHINTSDARSTGKEVKNKAYDAASDIKEGIKKTAQNVKEDFNETKKVMTTAGNTIKETALKVVDDVKEGAMEVKGDNQRAKERSKRS